ncbi:hypothetical protein PA10_00129 [Pseudomonas phage pPa_SNUABM_DT01]|nr:hypothetical protein PA10_00129 [Pseudomonas phage pPa_SNUABM_DT01]
MSSTHPGYISAARLEDLRDLCQPSQFNTTEEAHSALHNGIIGLLKNTDKLWVDARRLIPGDMFMNDDASGRVFIVKDRFFHYTHHTRLSQRMVFGEPQTPHGTNVLQGEYLELSLKDTVPGASFYACVHTGLIYSAVADKDPFPDYKIGKSVYLITKP